MRKSLFSSHSYTRAVQPPARAVARSRSTVTSRDNRASPGALIVDLKKRLHSLPILKRKTVIWIGRSVSIKDVVKTLRGLSDIFWLKEL